MRNINKIILHCTATLENVFVDSTMVRDWHMKERGWSDIGYHYLIRLDGTVEKGRDESRIGAHVKGHNKDSIGIAYVGGLDKDMKPKDTRTVAQMVSLDQLILNLLHKYPNSSLHGHNEFSSKACPSFDVQIEYKNLMKYGR